ncbi:hypothetical protein ASG87_07175 [Frateuria sp. Soil773]|nr:hypothetical protein ASG87_07175 [Frateuria sp. Soil773]
MWGIGHALPEAPERVSGCLDQANDRLLEEGMVITIEPFIHFGEEPRGDGDGRRPRPWLEHAAACPCNTDTIITRDRPIVVTLH